MNRLIFMGFIIGISGCAAIEDLDNILLIREADTSTVTDAVFPDVRVLSIQSKGEIKYPFRLQYETEDKLIEIANP